MVLRNLLLFVNWVILILIEESGAFSDYSQSDRSGDFGAFVEEHNFGEVGRWW